MNTTPYHSATFTPELVQAAIELAAREGFTQSSTPAVGRLLRVLAGSVQHGTIGEIGSGCGVGTAWLAGALAPGATLVTIEADPRRALLTRELFAPLPNVRVLVGDWHRLLPYGPFALLFADGGKAKEQEAETLLGMLHLGGLLMLDDLTPEDQWPPEWRGRRDSVRARWLNDQRLAATELLVTPSSAVILATRIA